MGEAIRQHRGCRRGDSRQMKDVKEATIPILSGEEWCWLEGEVTWEEYKEHTYGFLTEEELNQ